MTIDGTLLNLLVLLVSGATAVVVGLVFKRLGEIGLDVKEIREDVGQHSADLARRGAEIDQLRRDVDGLINRERDRRLAAIGD